jgi:osmotically-inducible protein OsmY
MVWTVAVCRAAMLIMGLTSCMHELDSMLQQWKEDDALADRVEDALLEARQLNLSHVEVDVQNGVVYLIGEMDTSDSKIKARQIAASIPGVKNVVNKLEVEP